MYSTIVAAALTGFALVKAQTPPVPGVTGQLGDAAIVNNNPAGATYIATLPNSPTTGVCCHHELYLQLATEPDFDRFVATSRALRPRMGLVSSLP